MGADEAWSLTADRSLNPVWGFGWPEDDAQWANDVRDACGDAWPHTGNGEVLEVSVAGGCIDATGNYTNPSAPFSTLLVKVWDRDW